MTYSEMMKERTNAVKFYGVEAFIQIQRVAEQYMKDNKIPVPADGVLYMPSFWATVKQLIADDVASK